MYSRDPISLADYEELARPALSASAYDYYAGGSDDEVTMRANRAAYERIPLHYRVLRDVSRRDLSTELLGEEVSLPVAIAPMAFHQLAAEEGELATARAAAAAGTILTLSTLSTRPIEEVAVAAGGRLWFQLYVYRDREITADLVARAESAGAKAIVLTVDAPLLGNRERDVRNGFQLPPGLRMVNLQPAGRADLPEVEGSGLAAYFGRMMEPSLSWTDLEWLCSRTSLPVLVKGIVRPDDGAEAVAVGAAGVIVSNHGGRQLDTAPATIDVLAPVAEAVGDRGITLVDGGIRRGTDVVKALALGARGVLVGRPVLWGLAVGGERGVAGVLEILRREIDLAMALCGASTVGEVTRDLVGR